MTEEHLLILDLRQRTLSRHRFLPDPACEICGSLPEDSPALGAIRLQSRPKSGPLAYRARPLTELARVLEEAYADSRAGLMNRVFVPSATPFADVCVNLPLFGADEVAAGRSHAYWTSKQTAILEGLERYCGLMARDRRIVVSGAYRQLSGQAADPGSFGLYPPERYEEEDCEFQPFDPEAAIEWVWGYSLTEGRPKLVPLAFAYYHVSGMGGFAYETSNGCAVGGSLEEAILHGIWEAVERDAFLLAWHARLPAPRIDPDAFGDEECSLMIERLRSVYGFEVRMFDITTDIGIPCLWVMAKNLADGGISQISAAGGHPDPVHAAKSAMFELAGLLPSIDLAFGEHRARCEEMLDNDELVEEMSDHALLYCLPEAAKRLDFLGGTEPAGGSGGEVRTWRMATGNLCRNGDLREDLEELTDVFRKLGLEILVVNQTAPELARHGLACVKVLVPGLLPMTFGHRNSRIAGLERARRLPRDLGYAAEPLGPERLNLRPHPFP